ncbi:flagellar protein FlgN [Iocasia frigidifontis]|uniref:flagellar protein FlgN n=1 Tax=Iocasia fonsfrigidae TaxID=2682810 RepID=UPI001E321FB1|nr:flagellar protein FlgN [Iocasia fonsfrigidae]
MPLSEFKEIFKKEYEQYCILLDKAQSKQQAIMENDIDELAEIVSYEQEIIELIEELESKRHSFLNDFAAEKKAADTEFSFAELMAFMPEEREGMQELKADFLTVLDQLQQINEENKQLIEDSLKISEYSLELIRQAVGKENVYSKKDKSDSLRQTNHIINKKI